MATLQSFKANTAPVAKNSIIALVAFKLETNLIAINSSIGRQSGLTQTNPIAIPATLLRQWHYAAPPPQVVEGGTNTLATVGQVLPR
jgi:hypothetical protein